MKIGYSGSTWVGCEIKGKDRAGHARTVKKVISPIGGEAPTVPIENKIGIVGNIANVITYAKFQDDIFGGYYITGGRKGGISHFSIYFVWALQQCSATALP